MTTGWVVYLLAVGALLTMAARSFAWGAHAVGLPTRWLWTGALAGIVALAVISPRQEPVGLVATTRVSTARPIAEPSSEEVGLVERVRDASLVVGETAASVVSSIERHVPAAVARALLVAWLVTSGSLLVLFAIVHVRLARVRRGWDVRRAHGLRILVAPATGPAVLGLVRPEIVVPRSLLERSADEQRLILQHEREHLAARDHLLLAGAWLAVIALPWHPAIWFLLGRLRLAIELDCDARLLREGVPARRYGALLIDMAERSERLHVGALALADGPSHLERRILAMRAPRKRFAKTLGVAVGTMGAALTFVACEAKIPTSAEISAMDVASAQRSASEAGFMRTPRGDRTDFFVDGVKVSAEQARALQAREIGSITVVKSERATGRDTILVVSASRPSEEEKRASASRPRDPFDDAERAFESRRSMSDSTEHTVARIESERASQRMRSDANVSSRSMRPTLRSAGDKPPTITIDGKIASEAQLAALDERDIASIAVYKGKEGQLLMRSDGKEHLEVTSGPPVRSSANDSDALIAVTTKMARRAPSRNP